MAAPQASCPTSTATSLSFPDRPSRILTDLLNDPQPNSPSHLLILSLTALDDLNDKYAHLKAIHGGTRITYLAARHIFNEILAEFNQCKDAPEPVVRAVNTANAACEKVEREMGIITKAMGKCEKESMVLSGDVGVASLRSERLLNGGACRWRFSKS